MSAIEDEWKDSFRDLINNIGHSVADINKLCVENLNEDFALMNSLPFGKILSDMTGLCVSLNNFEIANKSALNNLVCAPINKRPPNPFTGVVDTQILLECMNIIESEEAQEYSTSNFLDSPKYFVQHENLNELVNRANTFNTSLEKTQIHFANLAKPQKYLIANPFGKYALQRSKQKFTTPELEAYLKAIEEGKGTDLEVKFDFEDNFSLL